MRVVVTGGSGFLGSHVVEQFLDRDHEVIVFDIAPPPQDILGRAGCRYVQGDLRDREALVRAFHGALAVCHLGGVGDVYLAANEPETAMRLNGEGSVNVADAALKNDVRRLIYASTWEVYGAPQYQPLDEQHPCRPDHPYNVSKYAGELMLLAYHHLRSLPVLALRLGTSYGVRMRPNSVFSLFIGKARAGDPITIQGNGEQARQFTHATDIGRAFAMAAESELSGTALNIVSPETVTIKQLAEMVQERFPTSIVYLPPRAGDISPAQVSAALAEKELGWNALVPFREGLRNLMEHHARTST